MSSARDGDGSGPRDESTENPLDLEEFDSDDDALEWAGDEAIGRSAAAPGSGVRSAVADSDDPEDDAEQVSSVGLVAYGAFAGIAALYTVGWIITVMRSQITMTSILGEIMFQFGEVLAIASPVLWFAVAMWLTRGKRTPVRFLWLALGLIVTLPLPFVLGR